VDQVAVEHGRDSGRSQSATTEFSSDFENVQFARHLIRDSLENLRPHDILCPCGFQNRREHGIP